MRKRKNLLRSIAIALALVLAFSGNSSVAVCAAQSAAVKDVDIIADARTGELELVYGNEALSDEDAFVLMIMGDGFTSDEQEAFYEAAKNTADYMMACSPFDEFSDVIKVYALGVESNESGVQGEDAATEAEAAVDVRDTYFGATFWAWGMQRLVDLSEEGAARGYALQEKYLPNADYIAYLVNSDTYGGSGGDYCTASLNSSSLEIMIHELGHTVAGLSDEYYAPGYEGEYANLTQESDPERVAWSRFIGKNGIGVYDWGGVPGTGWYTPHTGCKMQYLGADYPFCEVCKEELRKAISADSNITKMFFQTYADEFPAGAAKDMKEYFIIRNGENETTGDKLGDALTLTYKDASGNVVDGIPEEAGTYTIEAVFAGNDIYDACSMNAEYTIDAVSISLNISSKKQDGEPAVLDYSVDCIGEYGIGIDYYGYQYYGYYTYDEYSSSMYTETPEPEDDVYDVVYYKYDSYNSEYLAYDEYRTTEGPKGPGAYTVTLTVYDKEGNVLGEKSVDYAIYFNTEAITDNNDSAYYGAMDYGNNKNILIYGEGFTVEEQDRFFEMAGRLTDGILSTEPFRETSLYFNFTAVQCISNESGIGTEPKDTFFRLTYDENGAIVPTYSATDIATNMASSIKQYYDGCIVIVNDDNALESSAFYYNYTDYPSYSYYYSMFVTPDEAGIEYAANELLNHLLLAEEGCRAETEEEKEAQRLALLDALYYSYSPVIVSRAYDESYTEDGTAFDLTSSFKVYLGSEELDNVPLTLTYFTDNNGEPGELLDGAPSKAGTYHVLAETIPNDADGWLWYVPEGGTDDDGMWIGFSRGWTTYTIAEAEKEPETTEESTEATEPETTTEESTEVTEPDTMTEEENESSGEADLPSVLEEAIVKKLEKLGTGESLSETVAANSKVQESVFEKMLDKKATLILEVKGAADKTLVKYTIDGSKFEKAPDTELDLNVALGAENEVTASVKKQLGLESEKELYLMDFAHSGELNGELEITVYPDNYSRGMVLKLYYFDEQRNEAVDMGQTIVVADDGSATFKVKHFSSYLLVKSEENADQPSQSEAETTTQSGAETTQAQESSGEETSAASTESGEALSPSTGFASSAAACALVMVAALGVAVVCASRKKTMLK